MTEPTYSMAQLALILSALENQRRNPNSKQTAMKAIERAAAALGLSTADVFAAADGLLDGRLSAEAWRAQLIGMLRRPEGATIAQMMTQMAWMAHTVRGVLAGALKKRRELNVISDKPQGGERVYRLVN